MTHPDVFNAQVPPELIQPALVSPEALPVVDPGTTAAAKINTISNSILQTGAEIAPGILLVAGMIYVFRKVYQHTLGDIL